MRRIGHGNPGTGEIARLARAALARLPIEFRNHLADVVVRVEEFADDETLRAMDVEDAWELTGLYQGLPVGEQSVWSTGELPPVISLFRQPLLMEWRETGVDFADLVNHVIVHEVGHHFGLSDEEMQAIEDETP